MSSQYTPYNPLDAVLNPNTRKRRVLTVDDPNDLTTEDKQPPLYSLQDLGIDQAPVLGEPSRPRRVAASASEAPTVAKMVAKGEVGRDSFNPKPVLTTETNSTPISKSGPLPFKQVNDADVPPPIIPKNPNQNFTTLPKGRRPTKANQGYDNALYLGPEVTDVMKVMDAVAKKQGYRDDDIQAYYKRFGSHPGAIGSLKRPGQLIDLDELNENLKANQGYLNHAYDQAGYEKVQNFLKERQAERLRQGQLSGEQEAQDPATRAIMGFGEGATLGMTGEGKYKHEVDPDEGNKFARTGGVGRAFLDAALDIAGLPTTQTFKDIMPNSETTGNFAGSIIPFAIGGEAVAPLKGALTIGDAATALSTGTKGLEIATPEILDALKLTGNARKKALGTLIGEAGDSVGSKIGQESIQNSATMGLVEAARTPHDSEQMDAIQNASARVQAGLGAVGRGGLLGPVLGDKPSLLRRIGSNVVLGQVEGDIDDPELASKGLTSDVINRMFMRGAQDAAGALGQEIATGSAFHGRPKPTEASLEPNSIIRSSQPEGQMQPTPTNNTSPIVDQILNEMQAKQPTKDTNQVVEGKRQAEQPTKTVPAAPVKEPTSKKLEAYQSALETLERQRTALSQQLDQLPENDPRTASARRQLSSQIEQIDNESIKLAKASIAERQQLGQQPVVPSEGLSPREQLLNEQVNRIKNKPQSQLPDQGDLNEISDQLDRQQPTSVTSVDSQVPVSSREEQLQNQVSKIKSQASEPSKLNQKDIENLDLEIKNKGDELNYLMNRIENLDPNTDIRTKKILMDQAYKLHNDIGQLESQRQGPRQDINNDTLPRDNNFRTAEDTLGNTEPLDPNIPREAFRDHQPGDTYGGGSDGRTFLPMTDDFNLFNTKQYDDYDTRGRRLNNIQRAYNQEMIRFQQEHPEEAAKMDLRLNPAEFEDLPADQENKKPIQIPEGMTDLSDIYNHLTEQGHSHEDIKNHLVDQHTSDPSAEFAANFRKPTAEEVNQKVKEFDRRENALLNARKHAVKEGLIGSVKEIDNRLLELQKEFGRYRVFKKSSELDANKQYTPEEKALYRKTMQQLGLMKKSSAELFNEGKNIDKNKATGEGDNVVVKKPTPTEVNSVTDSTLPREATLPINKNNGRQTQATEDIPHRPPQKSPIEVKRELARRRILKQLGQPVPDEGGNGIAPQAADKENNKYLSNSVNGIIPAEQLSKEIRNEPTSTEATTPNIEGRTGPSDEQGGEVTDNGTSTPVDQGREGTRPTDSADGSTEQPVQQPDQVTPTEQPTPPKQGRNLLGGKKAKGLSKAEKEARAAQRAEEKKVDKSYDRLNKTVEKLPGTSFDDLVKMLVDPGVKNDPNDPIHRQAHEELGSDKPFNPEDVPKYETDPIRHNSENAFKIVKNLSKKEYIKAINAARHIEGLDPMNGREINNEEAFYDQTREVIDQGGAAFTPEQIDAARDKLVENKVNETTKKITSTTDEDVYINAYDNFALDRSKIASNETGHRYVDAKSSEGQKLTKQKEDYIKKYGQEKYDEVMKRINEEDKAKTKSYEQLYENLYNPETGKPERINDINRLKELHQALTTEESTGSPEKRTMATILKKKVAEDIIHRRENIEKLKAEKAAAAPVVEAPSNETQPSGIRQYTQEDFNNIYSDIVQKPYETFMQAVDAEEAGETLTAKQQAYKDAVRQAITKVMEVNRGDDPEIIGRSTKWASARDSQYAPNTLFRVQAMKYHNDTPLKYEVQAKAPEADTWRSIPTTTEELARGESASKNTYQEALERFQYLTKSRDGFESYIDQSNKQPRGEQSTSTATEQPTSKPTEQPQSSSTKIPASEQPSLLSNENVKLIPGKLSNGVDAYKVIEKGKVTPSGKTRVTYKNADGKWMDEHFPISSFTPTKGAEPLQGGSKSTVLGFGPGVFTDFTVDLAKNITDKLVQGGKDAVSFVRQLHSWVRDTIDPASASRLARRVANLGRVAMGTEGLMNAKNQRIFAGVADYMGKKSDAELNQFVNDIERGNKHSDPVTQEIANMVTGLYDQVANRMAQLSPDALKTYHENYYGRIFKRSSLKNAQQMVARTTSSIEGAKGFLKRRTYEFHQDAIDAGLVPIDRNPVNVMMLKIAEMNRFLAGKEYWDSLTKQDLVKPFGVVQAKPDGWVKVNDKLASNTKYIPDKDGVVHRDTTTEYYAPPEVARIINNYTDNATIDVPGKEAWMAVGRLTNLMHVSFSTFHLKNIAWDGAFTKVQNGLDAFIGGGQKLLARDAKGAVKDFKQGAVDIFNATRSPYLYYQKGRQLKYYAKYADLDTVHGPIKARPNNQDPIGPNPLKPLTLAERADALQPSLDAAKSPLARAYETTRDHIGNFIFGDPSNIPPGLKQTLDKQLELLRNANARLEPDPIHNSDNFTKKFLEAVRDKDYTRMAWTSVPALAETVSRPLMHHFIPSVKVGAFVDLAQRRLDAHDPARLTQTDQIEIARQAWDEIEDRMGEVTPDNAFMTKNAQTVVRAAIAFNGWTFGTGRAVLRAAGDTARAIPKAIAQSTDTMSNWNLTAPNGQPLDPNDFHAVSGEPRDTILQLKDPVVTHRMKYFLSGAIGLAAANSLYMYATQGQWPQEPKDYLFPPTGRINPDGSKERLTPPTIVKDVYGMLTQPVEYLKGRFRPEFNTALEWYKNKDYAGFQIANPNDNPLKFELDRGLYVLKQLFTPFSVSNEMKKEQLKRYDEAKDDPMMALWHTVTADQLAPAYITHSKAQRLLGEYTRQALPEGGIPRDIKDKLQARKEIREGLEIGDPTNLQKAVEEGYLSPDQGKTLLDSYNTSSDVKRLERLDMDKSLNVYEASDKSERRKYAPVIIDKLDSLENKTPEQRYRILDRMKQLGIHSLMNEDLYAHNYNVSSEKLKALSKLETDRKFMGLPPEVKAVAKQKLAAIYNKFKFTKDEKIPNSDLPSIIQSMKEGFEDFSPEDREKLIQDIIDAAPDIYEAQRDQKEEVGDKSKASVSFDDEEDEDKLED